MQKVLELCGRQCFLWPVQSSLRFGFAGELLKNNIRQEWLFSMVVNTDENVFPFHLEGPVTSDVVQGLRLPFQHVKQLTNSQLPFGVAVTRSEMTPEQQGSYFQPQNHTRLWSCLFERPGGATQRFYQWQRQRKMWWRKFSASPGRFSLTDIETVGDAQLVDIRAEFPWGCETVETIRYSGAKPFDSATEADRELFEARDGRKKVLPHVIESSVSLEGSLLAFVCDAYHEQPRQVMRFHRKLAPYKVGFSASSSSASTAEELSQLALYLTRQLRGVGISTLLLPDVVRKTLEAQFARNDELGIPYTVVLNDASLKNGIVGLRSRDTTLKEQVHVSELRTYMEQLLNNY